MTTERSQMDDLPMPAAARSIALRLYFANVMLDSVQASANLAALS